MKKLTSTLVICLIANLAAAQTESSIEINQSGYDNETSTEQEGYYNSITINQLYELGHDNSATVIQRGVGNFTYGDVDQYGSFNMATIVQDGETQTAKIIQGNELTISNNNTASITQEGFNWGVQTQLNDNNTVTLIQVNKANQAKQYQESDPDMPLGNTAVAEQYGAYNHVDQYQVGYKNTLYSYQNSLGYGQESTTTQKQIGNCNVAQSFYQDMIGYVAQLQTGNNNFANAFLRSTFDGYVGGVTQSQEGNHNVSLAEINISSNRIVSRIYHSQKGDNNNANSYQDGDNIVNLIQDGSENYGYTQQNGVGNQANIRQLTGAVLSEAEVYQYGSNQVTIVSQQGVENSGKIIQGDASNQNLYGYNDAVQGQYGNNNTAEIRQVKIEQGIIEQGQAGSDNNVIALQGIDFEVEGNFIFQEQRGDNNEMSALQDRTQDMQQTSYNFIEQTQLGDGNVMSSIQLGTENNAYLTQNGDFNSLETTQIGSDNMLTITQNGNSNALIIAQEGSGHVNTIMQ